MTFDHRHIEGSAHPKKFNICNTKRRGTSTGAFLRICLTKVQFDQVHDALKNQVVSSWRIQVLARTQERVACPSLIASGKLTRQSLQQGQSHQKKSNFPAHLLNWEKESFNYPQLKPLAIAMQRCAWDTAGNLLLRHQSLKPTVSTNCFISICWF